MGPTRSSNALGAALLTLALSSSVAFAQAKVEPSETNVSGQAHQLTPIRRDQIRIGPGDLLAVSIYGVSDYKEEARVNESGQISLPLIGDVTVGGLTIQQSQDTIEKALVSGGYYRDPHVSVVIREYTSEGISIMGEVGKPGVYPILGTKRLYDVVSAAGGFTSNAGRLITIAHRDSPEKAEKVYLTDDPAKAAGANVQVFPGDTIVVSKAGVVYVVGDVNRPGGFVMANNEKMTVLEAVALAQGINRTAALSAARIIRRSPGAGPEEIKIPLKQILAAKGTDVELMPNDILFIPGSVAKGAARRGIDSVIEVATGLAIVGFR